ncbi:hypothetical protein BDN72DRAFT_849340 [Pluteus cervinus]|uniref:Uncharacterized protein n=1 Tax=Pluteus cervinus TaxID=181527 RepID=A0ACD3A8U5_9AGAR|nr:hypothetical protein BDN72DRAFT_849340 [Pluteus cervinus]
MCIRLITSPHRVMFFLKGMDWKDVPKKLSKALTAMIRLPTLRVCSLLMLWNLPISVFNDSQIHTLELLDVSFVCSPSEKRANPTETLKSKRIRLLNLEYRGAPFLPLKQTPFGGSMQPPLFDFSNLQSLGLSTLTHRNPELGTLITECGQSLQSLTISGGFLNVIDLAPLSGLRHLILGFINDEPRFDGTPTLIATVETLNTLKLTDSRLEKVDLFFAENGIALFNAETWDLLDNILFRFFQNSGRVQTIKVRFDAFYPYVSPKDMNLGVVRLPRCREAGLLVDSDA